MLSPSGRPVRTPSRWWLPAGSGRNAAVTSVPFSSTVTSARATLAGTVTSTRAAPPDTSSGGLDTTRSASAPWRPAGGPCPAPAGGMSTATARASAAPSVHRRHERIVLPPQIPSTRGSTVHRRWRLCKRLRAGDQARSQANPRALIRVHLHQRGVRRPVGERPYKDALPPSSPFRRGSAPAISPGAPSVTTSSGSASPSMRWADVYVCMLADGVALRNRCPQGQAPRSPGPHPRRATDG